MIYSEVHKKNSNFKQMFLYLQHRTYVHIFDFVRQDWFAVVSILEQTLITIRNQVPQLTTAYLRSDNAGCYHCGSLWSTLHCISERTGKTNLKL